MFEVLSILSGADFFIRALLVESKASNFFLAIRIPMACISKSSMITLEKRMRCFCSFQWCSLESVRLRCVIFQKRFVTHEGLNAQVYSVSEDSPFSLEAKAFCHS